MRPRSRTSSGWSGWISRIWPTTPSALPNCSRRRYAPLRLRNTRTSMSFLPAAVSRRSSGALTDSAGKTLFQEQELVEGYQGVFQTGLRGQPLLHAGGEFIDLPQVGLDVQTGVFLDRNEKRCFRQIQFLLGDFGDFGETFVHE